MLTEHEEKLIQRYYIYPKIAITAVIMALALGVPFILLEMIDDLVFHDEEVIFWGLYVYLGFAALYLILFCYCTLRAKLGMRKEEWQELQRRLKVRQQQSDYSAAAAGAMAMMQGLTSAIVNPNDLRLMETIKSCDIFKNNELYSDSYLDA